MTDDSERPEVLITGPFGDEPEGADDGWRHPATLALASLALAVLLLMGASALRGIAYASTFASDDGNGGLSGSKHTLVAGAALSTVFALLPVVLAQLGLSRLVPDDPAWAGHALRAAVLLGGLSVVLHALLVLVAARVGDGVVGLSFLIGT